MRSNFMHFFRDNLALAHRRNMDLHLRDRRVLLVKDGTENAILDRSVIDRSLQRVEMGFSIFELQFLWAVFGYVLILRKRPNLNSEYLKGIETDIATASVR